MIVDGKMEREHGNYRFIAEKLKEADNTSEITIAYREKKIISCSSILTCISKPTEKGAAKIETQYDKSLGKRFSHMATWERNIRNTHI